MSNYLNQNKIVSLKKDKNKKVLLLFYEPNKSGICRHIRYIIDTLNSDNYEFWILYSGDDDKIRTFFNEIIPANQIISVPTNRFFSFKGFLQARKIIRQQQIEIIHIHNLQSILWGYAGAITTGSRHLVFTPHIDTECAGFAQCSLRLLWRLFAPFTSNIIALSDYQRDWLITWKIIHKAKVTVINNHISEASLKHGTRRTSHKIPDFFSGAILKDKCIVSQIGRLDRQKDPFFLLNAAFLLKSDFPDLVFLLIGEGPMQKMIEKKIQDYNLQGHVVLTGHLPNIATVLRHSDIISLTSRWEGMPYALLEAACFKKAVIATDIPGNRSVVINNKNGFLVKSEQEFAQRLITLFQSPSLRRKMGENGYLMNRKLFNVNNMKKQFIDVYENYQA